MVYIDISGRISTPFKNDNSDKPIYKLLMRLRLTPKPKQKKIQYYKCYKCGYKHDTHLYYCPKCEEKDAKIRMLLLFEN